MSNQTGRGDRRVGPAHESGFEALRRSPAFRGPVDPADERAHGDEGSNAHFASLYDDREEQFGTAVPFVKQGLERGERCMYVVHENSEAEVRAAMRDYGVDVDAALDSGALSIRTAADTYLRTGELDQNAMVRLWEDALESAYEDGYDGLRAVAEMSWVLDSETSHGELIDYESVLNTVYPDGDYVVMCQYDRERFPPEVIRDVIRTHPYLVSDGTIYHNVYYTPPDEYFGPEDPARRVQRMMGTLRERSEAKTQLRERERYLRRQNEITSSPNRSFEEKLQALFDLGCERFDLELGAMACVDPDSDGFVLEYTSDDHEHFEPGTELPLSETYCTAVTETKGSASVSDPLEDGYEDITVHREFGLKTYLGTYVEVDAGLDRTFFFVSSQPRDEPFSNEERSFHRLLGQWVKYELERQQRERHQRTLYEIAADPDRTFEQRLHALFDLGCERFDLELGGIARIDPETDLFEVEDVSGDHDHLVPGARAELSETYCRVIADRSEVAGITDPLDRGFGNTIAYEEFGVQSYLGTRIELDDRLDRTLFFVSTSSRDEEFSEAERTFLHLMGQWVQYELEYNHRETQLERKNDRLESFASMLAHELRNPVTIGQIYSQQLPAETDAAAVEYVAEAFDRIEDMIDVMLVLTRGREAVSECTPVHLAETVREAWDDVDAPDASLDVELDRTIQADETYVRHLFRNLFENSVEHGSTSRRSQAHEDAVEHGSTSNRPSAANTVEPGSTSPRSQTQGNAVEDGDRDVTVTVGDLSTGFYVADDGVGIPPDDRDAVFEAGYTTAASEGGTGLGLAFVEELAAVYGWDCAVTESESGGARFEFRNVVADT